ncbi:energy-converting hydrogenase Eha subunit A [Rhizobium sp. BK529]|uniref:hypothetical protein n=1 Tax=Rhizobium sp. BK529 TaxID=2586983 RepID=UPI001617310B|nr:hypothetical protein [Rhizobium sp. BK529]MBB3591744.1 energy-converting hydrogenase Eha subunit A [Rhizobium sp. BK529]
MFTNISDLIKIPVAIFAGMMIASIFLVITYEGISLPLIGQVIDGRVSTEVKAATSTMVTTFERDAIAAQLAETERMLSEANRTAANARARADDTQRAKQAADARIAQLEAEAKPNQKLSRPNEEDYRWVDEH